MKQVIFQLLLLFCVLSQALGDVDGINQGVDKVLQYSGAQVINSLEDVLAVPGFTAPFPKKVYKIFRGRLNCEAASVYDFSSLTRSGDVSLSRRNSSDELILNVPLKLSLFAVNFEKCAVKITYGNLPLKRVVMELTDNLVQANFTLLRNATYKNCTSRVDLIEVLPTEKVNFMPQPTVKFVPQKLNSLFVKQFNDVTRKTVNEHLRRIAEEYIATSKLCEIVYREK